MRFIFRQAWREMKNSRSFCFFYSLNLTLGLVGFVLVDAFRESIESKMVNESRELLGGDLALRARRPLSYEELDRARSTLPTDIREAGTVDFFLDGSRSHRPEPFGQGGSDRPGFPFHGAFKLRLGGELRGDEIDLLHERKYAWIYPEARAQLGIDLGEELQLGETKFLISDLIKEETGLSFQPTDLAPKVFISREYLEDTNLLGEGSLAYYTHLFLLPPGTDSDAFGQGLEKAINSRKSAPTPTVRPDTGQVGFCVTCLIFFPWSLWLLCFWPVWEVVFFFTDFSTTACTSLPH